MSKNYSVEIVELVRHFLDEDDWHYSFDEERGVFLLGMSISSKLVNIPYTIRVGENSYTVYAQSPLHANTDNPEQMKNLAEFICRANFGLHSGNFELDFNSGEIRYKVHMDCNYAMPVKDMVGRSLYCPGAMFTRYGDGIVQVLINDMPAREAVALCEKDLFSEEPDHNPSEEYDDTCPDPEWMMDLLRRLSAETEMDDDEGD